MTERLKAISRTLDSWQSRLLTLAVGGILALFAFFQLKSILMVLSGLDPSQFRASSWQIWLWLIPWMVSLTFALLVWAIRAATFAGAFFGAAICLAIMLGTQTSGLWHSGLEPLFALFLFTFAATRAGRRRKQQLGVAEDRRGRSAAQVIANLGAAGLIAITGFIGLADNLIPYFGYFRLSIVVTPVLLLAALCEATADTVSSEIGQAFGGQPILLTTFRPVDAGTDGAVSLLGTATGIAGAFVVALAGMWSMRLPPGLALLALAGGVAGLFFDSLLGATLERRGWLGNDLVNFWSTAFAALTSVALLIATQRL